MRTRMSMWLVAGVVVAATSACGTDASSTATDRPGQESTASDPSPTTDNPDSPAPSLPTLEPPKGPPSQASDTFKEVTITGTVTTADGECVVLTADTGVTWSLLGALAADLEVGAPVTVTGMAVPESQVPSCPGAPLSVTVLK